MSKLSKYLGTTVLASALLGGALTLLPVASEAAGPKQTAAAATAKNEKHPHIRKAIQELKAAKKELEKADHDFGGHRVAAIAAADSAIEQLQIALKYDKK
jgi:hypothetical protein